jgi:hypothetical protein
MGNVLFENIVGEISYAEMTNEQLNALSLHKDVISKLSGNFWKYLNIPATEYASLDNENDLRVQLTRSLLEFTHDQKRIPFDVDDMLPVQKARYEKEASEREILARISDENASLGVGGATSIGISSSDSRTESQKRQASIAKEEAIKKRRNDENRSTGRGDDTDENSTPLKRMHDLFEGATKQLMDGIADDNSEAIEKDLYSILSEDFNTNGEVQSILLDFKINRNSVLQRLNSQIAHERLMLAMSSQPVCKTDFKNLWNSLKDSEKFLKKCGSAFVNIPLDM